MAFVVEMVRGKPNTPSFAYYACSGFMWDEALAIAQAQGWKRLGTSKDPDAMRGNPEYEDEFQPDYRPSEWRFSKCFSDEDARAFASALRRAVGSKPLPANSDCPTLLVDSAPVIESIIGADSHEALERLAAYAEDGCFAFAWDD